MKSLRDNDMYAVVRRSHLTTRLIPLPGYAKRGRRIPCFFKSLGDNNMYAVVRRSHLTTRLIPQNDGFHCHLLSGHLIRKMKHVS